MTFTVWLWSLLKSFLTLSHPIWSRCFLILPLPPSSNLVTIFSLTILFIVTRVCYLPPWPFQSLPLTLMSHLREAVSRTRGGWLFHFVPVTRPHSLYYLRKYLWMTKSQLCAKQICLPRILSNITNNKNGFWKTVRPTNVQKPQLHSISIF